MSWLLVACIPGLLMLATLSLGQLERTLAHGIVLATDTTKFLEQAEPFITTDSATAPGNRAEVGSPTRPHKHSRPDPQFAAAQHANRV